MMKIKSSFSGDERLGIGKVFYENEGFVRVKGGFVY